MILTGDPGVGKTTVLQKTVRALGEQSVSVGGMISREVREAGNRVGFEVLNIASDQVGWLARINQNSGPRVGKYRVNLGDLDGVGVRAINDALAASDVIAIDEIGPMELFSEKFKTSIRNVLESSKLVIAVVHFRSRDPLVDLAKERADAEVFVVSEENRERLPGVLVNRAIAFLNPL